MRRLNPFYPFLFAALLAAGPAFPCAKKYEALAKTKILTNFNDDTVKVIRAHLAKLGVVVPPNATVDEAIHMSLSYQHRRLPVQPWKVVMVPGIAQKPLPKEIQEGLALFAAKAQRGEDLLPHMSKQIANPTYNDGLFNDWRIYHFHLGTMLEPNGKFITRTNELAFAMQYQGTLYFLDVQPHAGSFTDRQLLEIAHQNFPQILERYKLKGMELTAESLAVNRDATLRPTLRKVGLNVAHQMDDGTLYMSPGGGFALGGGSADVRIATNRFRAHIYAVKEYVEKLEPEIRAAIAADGKPVPETLHIELTNLTYRELEAVETQSGVPIRIPFK